MHISGPTSQCQHKSISVKPTPAAMLNEFLRSRPAIGGPADGRDDGVDVAASVEVLWAIADLDEGCSVLVSDLVTGGLNAGMVSVDMLVGLGFMDTRVSLEDLLCCCCWAARSCWTIAALDCPCALQDRMPSCHVCSACALPEPPQVPNQVPPRPQQLLLPDLPMATHVAQTALMVFVVAAE